MKKIFLLITLFFLLTFLGTMALAQKAILQTDCGKIECVEKSAHFEDKYGPGNWTDAGAECICQYYTPEEWKLICCALGTGPPSEEELQIWRDCGVPVPGGPLSGSWGWTGEKEEEYEIHEPADLTQLTFLDKASDPDWSPDGSQIIFEEQSQKEGRLYLVGKDGTGLTKIGLGRNASWSPVDNRIIYRGEDRSLFLVDLDKGRESKVKLATRITEQGGWSPDGKKIVYDSYDVFGQSSSIWVMNSDGSEKNRLTTDEDDFCVAPSFNYDGSKIVYLKGFTSYVPGGGENAEPNEIWVMDADGSNKHVIYAPGDSVQLTFQRAWNKDNKILFMRTWYKLKPPQVWMINSDGSDSKVVVAGPAVYGDPVWDNAGTKVAITAVPFLEPGKETYNIWTFSYEEPSEEEVIEEPEEEVEKAPKNIFQKIWETIINFFKMMGILVLKISALPKLIISVSILQ